MQAAGPAYVVWLLVGVAVIAAAFTFRRSIVVRRNKRRARGFFVMGFIFGVTAGVMLKRRRRTIRGLGPVIRWVAVRRRRTGIRGGTSYFAARALAAAASYRELL